VIQRAGGIGSEMREECSRHGEIVIDKRHVRSPGNLIHRIRARAEKILPKPSALSLPWNKPLPLSSFWK
jgi:hypothetical protein